MDTERQEKWYSIKHFFNRKFVFVNNLLESAAINVYTVGNKYKYETYNN